jgi:hypothetical protein
MSSFPKLSNVLDNPILLVTDAGLTQFAGFKNSAAKVNGKYAFPFKKF